MKTRVPEKITGSGPARPSNSIAAEEATGNGTESAIPWATEAAELDVPVAVEMNTGIASQTIENLASSHRRRLSAPSRDVTPVANPIDSSQHEIHQWLGQPIVLWYYNLAAHKVVGIAGRLALIELSKFSEETPATRLAVQFSEYYPKEFFAQVDDASSCYRLPAEGYDLPRTMLETLAFSPKHLLGISPLDLDERQESLRAPGHTLQIAADTRALHSRGEADEKIPDFKLFSDDEVKAYLYKHLAPMFLRIISEMTPLRKWENLSKEELDKGPITQLKSILETKRGTTYYRQAAAAFTERAQRTSSLAGFEDSIAGGFFTALSAMLPAAVAVAREYHDADHATKIAAWKSALTEIKPLMRMHLAHGVAYTHALIDEEGHCFQKSLSADTGKLEIPKSFHREAEGKTGRTVDMPRPGTIGCPALQLGIMEQLLEVLEPNVTQLYFTPKDVLSSDDV